MARRGNVREPLSPLLGREFELETLERWLEEEGCRVVTLRGAPGIGKSHLAATFAAERTPRSWPAGVWLAPSIEEARTLLKGPLQGRALVIIDEPPADELRRALTTWLAETPGLHLLLTTQARPPVPSERVMTLGPLERETATSLFCTRAEDARGAPLPATSRDVVGALVEALDGLPLAIEIAAGLALAPEEVLPRLQSGQLRGLGRPEALETALARAWASLSPEELEMVLAVAPFIERFSLEDAERVAPALDVAATLTRLTERSLIRVEPSDQGTQYELVGLVRERARLEAEARGESRGRARQWARVVIARATEAKDMAKWTPLRAPLLRLVALAEEDPELDPDAAGLLVLARLARVLGPVGQVLEHLDSALERDAGWPPAVRGQVLRFRGVLQARHGDARAGLRSLGEARRLLNEGLEVAQTLGDIADIQRHLEERDAAVASYEEALEILRAAPSLLRGAPRDEALLLAGLATTLHEAGALEEAKVRFEAALDALWRAGPATPDPGIRQNYGLLLQELGDLQAADNVFREELEAHRKRGNRRFEGVAEFDLGCVALERGAAQVAMSRFEAAASVAREVGDRRELGLSYALLGVAHATLDDLDHARDAFARAQAELEHRNDTGAMEALVVHQLHLDLARARREDDPGASLDRIESLLARSEALAGLGDEVRLARRVVAQELGRLEGGVVRVARDGSWIQARDGSRVDLSGRVPLRGLLRGLAERHLIDPAAPVSAEELLPFGWPDAHALTSKNKNRLHVAITTLRKLGLQGHLLRERAGYRLDAVLVAQPAGFAKGAPKR